MYKIQVPISECRQSRFQNKLILSHTVNFVFCSFFVRLSLCHTNQETKEENLLGENNLFKGQFFNPCNLLYKAQDQLNPCTVQAPKQVLIFPCFVGPSLLYTNQETQEENLLGGTNSRCIWPIHLIIQTCLVQWVYLMHQSSLRPVQTGNVWQPNILPFGHPVWFCLIVFDCV